MPAVFLLEWTFTPANLFEERVEFSFDVGVFVIDAGKVEARIPEEAYPPDHSLRAELHEQLNTRFLAAQVLSHKAFTLSKPTVMKVHADGRRDAWLFAESATLTISGGTVDFVVKDAAGNLIRDTKRERIEHRKDLANTAASMAEDPVASSILRSYSAAVNDPANELVHLYEIRDALGTHFQGEKAAIAALGITSAQWSTLGRLANEEPLREGRHRGKKLGALREATKAELEQARAIARALVQGYLRHK